MTYNTSLTGRAVRKVKKDKEEKKNVLQKVISARQRKLLAKRKYAKVRLPNSAWCHGQANPLRTLSRLVGEISGSTRTWRCKQTGWNAVVSAQIEQEASKWRNPWKLGRKCVTSWTEKPEGIREWLDLTHLHCRHTDACSVWTRWG